MKPIKKLQRAIALRADLSNQDRKDRRRCRYLSVGMEEQRQRVMQALGSSHVLTLRMRECGKVDEWDNMKLCGVPTCPRCVMNRRAQQTGQAIKKTFKDIPNEQLAFLTLLIPDLPAHIWEVSPIIQEAELKLRNFIIRSRRKDPRWDNVHFVGYWELDRIEAGEISELGRNKQRFVRHCSQPAGLGSDVTLWLPHFHAVVALGEVSREEFAEGLRDYGHGASHQVDLRAFHQHCRVEENLRDVVRYANKFRIETQFKAAGGPFAVDVDPDVREERSWWPDADIKALTEWLCLEQKGFQSLRFVVGSKKKTTPVASELRSNEGSSSSSALVEIKDDSGSKIRPIVSRYNKPLQDTNWQPRTRRRNAANVEAFDLADHPLFSCNRRSPSLDLKPSVTAAAPSREPSSQIGSTLRSAIAAWRQRAS